jgi:hypothetical protein
MAVQLIRIAGVMTVTLRSDSVPREGRASGDAFGMGGIHAVSKSQRRRCGIAGPNRA